MCNWKIIDLPNGNKQFVCTECGDKSPEIPAITAKAVIIRRNLWAEIICPFCGKRHSHSPQPIPALRSSHCGFDGKQGKKRETYLLEFPLAYKGGTYFIKEILSNGNEKALIKYNKDYEIAKKRSK